MTLTYQTQKGTSAAAALALAGDIIDSDPDSLVSIKNEEEDDGNLESKHNCEKYIIGTTVWPLESPSRNEGKDYEDKEGNGPQGEK